MLSDCRTQLRDPLEIDHNLRLDPSAPQLDYEVGSTRQQTGIWTVLIEQGNCFRHRPRPRVRKSLHRSRPLK
jgi:hypothetical protein